jgi:ankyrin repeat protein
MENKMKKLLLSIVLLIGACLPLMAMDVPANLDEQLFDSIYANNVAGVKQCLEAGANANAQENQSPGNFALETAANYCNEAPYEAICALLLKHGADINARDSDGQSLLHRTICTSCIGAKRLLKLGPDINIKNNGGETCLIMCAKKGFHLNCKILIDHNANLDEQDLKGNTALIYTAIDAEYSCPHNSYERKQYTHCCTLLLNAAADHQIKNNKGEDLWDIANKYNFHEIIKLLQYHVQLRTELFNACGERNFPKFNEILKDHPLLINFRGKDGSTMLMCAAYAGHFDLCQQLLKANSKAHLKAYNGQTAFDMA